MSIFKEQEVNKIREITGCGMSECKRALTSCDGDVEVAKEYVRLRKQAVCRYSMVNGVKRRWSDEEYVELAKEIVRK